MFRNLVVEVTKPVGRVVLNRPARLNALSLDLIGELIEAASLFSASDTRVVIVTGAGRAFSAGFDLADFTDGVLLAGEPDRRHAAADLGRRMASALMGMRQVTVAAMRGPVVGGGLVIAAACDLRVASEDSVISIPEVDLGIGLAWGAIPLLVQELGPALTRELVMTCRPFPAQEALQRGFLNRVVSSDDLEEAALELAGSIARRPSLAIETTKRHVNEVLAHDFSRDDAADLLQALEDPESIAARRSYMERITGQS